MPSFLVPLHEYNPCHNPAGSPAGGQFCATSGAGNPKAHMVRAGQDYDLVASAAEGQSGAWRKSRRFLFNPKTGELAVGGAAGFEGRDTSHADAFAAAVRGPNASYDLALSRQYDTFTIHGHLRADTERIEAMRRARPMTIVIDRVVGLEETPAGFRSEAGSVEEINQLYEMARRFASWGATADTLILAHGLAGGREVTLGKAFPELFPKARRRKAA